MLVSSISESVISSNIKFISENLHPIISVSIILNSFISSIVAKQLPPRTTILSTFIIFVNFKFITCSFYELSKLFEVFWLIPFY